MRSCLAALLRQHGAHDLDEVDNARLETACACSAHPARFSAGCASLTACSPRRAALRWRERTKAPTTAAVGLTHAIELTRACDRGGARRAGRVGGADRALGPRVLASDRRAPRRRRGRREGRRRAQPTLGLPALPRGDRPSRTDHPRPTQPPHLRVPRTYTTLAHAHASSQRYRRHTNPS